jgi:hypothetical protein
MKNIISFFGASVTEQKNGYPVQLSKKILNTSSHIFGYGGNHIDDAGICFIDNVIKINPNYCFIDFFSTAYTSISEATIEYLDTIVYKLTKINCKIIFLFLLSSGHESRIEFYDFLKNYIESKKLYYIDLNNYLKYNSNICRDTVHTTDFGSEEYARVIYDIFQKDKDNIGYPINIINTKYCQNIKILNVNKIYKNNIIFKGNCFIIAFNLIIGKNSGFIDINGETKECIWDQWCHYDRSHFNLKKIYVKDKLEIKILQDDIDYSICRRYISEKNINKFLNIINIYYIGDKLDILENSS